MLIEILRKYTNVMHGGRHSVSLTQIIMNPEFWSIPTRADAESWSYEETGTLNPNWVEWLMGFPIGWTDLNV